MVWRIVRRLSPFAVVCALAASVVACSTPVPTDSDDDGVPDEIDACVDEPEDYDGFEDGDGCPEIEDQICSDTCEWAFDGECDDGGPNALYDLCALGSDCADCGRRETTGCRDSCEWAFDGECDDGGPDSLYGLCALGSDCADCGVRRDVDEDGVLEGADLCPREPEDIDFYQDADGCPEPDPTPIPGRHALLIGIGDYETLNDITGDRDIPLLGEALRLHGFGRANISTLRNAEANIYDLRLELVRWAQQLAPGDIGFVHFGGHGAQTWDDDVPLEESDALDEVLAPWDATPDPSSMLRDDEFADFIRFARENLGHTGHLIVSVDACFSGTVSRGTAAVRSVGRVGERPEGLDVPGAAAGAGEPSTRELFAREEGLAPAVILTAARDLEPAAEVPDGQTGQTYGGFTLALSRALARATPATTYDELMHHVIADVARAGLTQLPQIEGDGAMRLFDGRSDGSRPHFNVLGSGGDPGLVVVDVSSLVAGYGSRLSFHPVGSGPGDSEPLASGLLLEAHLYESLVALNDEAFGTDLSGAWAYLERASFNDWEVTFSIDPNLSAESQGRLEGIVGEIEFVRLSPAPTHLTAVSIGDDAVSILTPMGAELLPPRSLDDADLGGAIEYAVNRAVIATMLFSFEPAPGHDYGLWQLDYESAVAEGHCTGEERLPHMGLNVQNSSWEPGYLAVFSVDSTGRISQLYPERDTGSHEGFLTPDVYDFRVPACVPVDPDVTYVALMTGQPIDFSTVTEAPEGARSRSIEMTSPARWLNDTLAAEGERRSRGVGELDEPSSQRAPSNGSRLNRSVLRVEEPQ